MLGDYGGGGTPVPFPNTEVKPSRADDTAALSGGKVGRRQAFLFFSARAVQVAEQPFFIRGEGLIPSARSRVRALGRS